MMTLIETGIYGRMAENRPTSTQFTDRIVSYGFVLFIAYPYGVFTPLITAVILNGTALVLGLLIIIIHGPPRLGGMLIFFAAIFLWTLYAFWIGIPMELIVSQSNHLWQYMILLPFAVHAMSQKGGLEKILRSRRVIALLVASTALSFLYSWSNIGYVHEFYPNSLSLVVALIYSRTSNVINFIFALGVISIFFVSGRSSPLMVGAIIILMRFMQIPSLLVKLGALIIIITPILIYLHADSWQMLYLYNVDHNVYIRAEFIRGAFSNFREHLGFGVGFGPSFRPINFHYLTQHSLLTNFSHLNNTSNHHSIFDTAYRFGLPLGCYFVTVIFLWPDLRGNQMAKAFCLTLALALSVNAWFENQSQLPNVVLLSGYLISLQARRRQTQ